MTQPRAYSQTTTFNDHSTVAPADPHSGANLDTEFVELKQNLDDVNTNLALLQRDDGKLLNTAVHKDAFDQDALAFIGATGSGFTPKGAWVTATAYVAGDLVTNNAATYLTVTAAHTSGSTFAGDLATHWQLIANSAIETTSASIDMHNGDGSNKVFTTTYTYAAVGDIQVFVNGALQPTNLYTVTNSGGNNITFTASTSAPSLGTNNVIIWGATVVAEAAKAGALTYSATANNHKTTADRFANLVTGQVTDAESGAINQGYSSKAYAIGGTGVTGVSTQGSAKDWAVGAGGVMATQPDAAEYSAKEYATGTTAPLGSSKSWATKDTSAVASSLFSAKEYASGSSATGGTAKEWATNAGSAEVDSGAGYSSKAYAQDTGNDIGSSKDWAILGTQVSSTDYSSKQYAVGTPPDGSAKEWATTTGAAVDTTFSAKEYAQGTAASTGGSSKNWASQTGADVTGGSSGDKSAKSWSQETGANAPSAGSAKEWATETSAAVDTTFSAKEYAQGTQASTGGSAKDYATKVDGGVSGATSDHSSKAWSVGGTGVTGISAKGASRDWAIGGGGTMATTADDAEFSAKEYSQGVTATGGTSKQWSLGGGSHAIGTAVAGTDYSSKAYSQSTTAGTSTYGGSAKGWSSTAHDAAVPGAGSGDRSALHYSTDASNSAIAARASAAAVSQTFDNFADVYLGSMADGATADIGTLTGASWAKDSSSIAFTGTTGTISLGQELTTVASGYPVGANIIGSSVSTPLVISNSFTASGTGATLNFVGSGVYGAYHVAKDGPGLDNDGDALAIGMLYFNTTDNEMRIYGGSTWIAASAAGSASLLIYKYIATADQTSFTGNDAGGAALAYTANNINVFLNGVRLDASDYTASNGTSVVLGAGAALSDELVVVAFKSFTVADMVPASTGGTFSGAVTASGGITGALTGNASTATTLATARAINGVDFDGSQLITVTADANTLSNTTLKSTVVASSLTSVGTLGALTVTGAITGGSFNGQQIATFPVAATNNLGIGTNALNSVTTGDYNVGLGENALTTVTTQHKNMAVGYGALRFNVADDNVAIGFQALTTNTSGTGNFGFGTNTLQNNSTGSYNIGIGYTALLNNTGTGNTAIGSSAGGNITSGSDNICIGRNVNAASATGSNQLNIGNTIYADLSTGDISTSTTGKIKQKGAFMQSSTHQALTLGY
jgi:hypothetical protein